MVGGENVAQLGAEPACLLGMGRPHDRGVSVQPTAGGPPKTGATTRRTKEDAMPNLQVIIASTRPGRVGLPVGEWFYARAVAHGGFAVDLVDLAALNLPFMDEPAHPRLRRYTNPHTRDWSARVDAADAFVFVMPEYNHGFTAPLKNAIDYLHHEWAYKPAGFVSYGGVAAGTRAVQMLKPVLTVLKMTPLTEAVSIPFVTQFIDQDGRLQANELMEQATTAMLDELQRVESALRPLRQTPVAAAAAR
jgi:NAD(P)H-dependent FMN reductase